MTNVFVDGSAGTTGLRILDRLKARNDVSLITLPEALRKDLSAQAAPAAGRTAGPALCRRRPLPPVAGLPHYRVLPAWIDELQQNSLSLC